jgi:hypothetical protein
MASGQCPPPISASYRHQLPVIIITRDDVTNEYQPECIICFELLELGSIGCKLDCGHIFHPHCLEAWLLKQASCPECRYELPTDQSLAYENERKKRMRGRRIRLRKDELNRKTIKQLREIFEIYALSTRDCFEKIELIDRLISSGHVDLQKRAPPVEVRWYVITPVRPWLP